MFYALGYGGNGVSFSAHAGRRMAERIAGKRARYSSCRSTTRRCPTPMCSTWSSRAPSHRSAALGAARALLTGTTLATSGGAGRKRLRQALTTDRTETMPSREAHTNQDTKATHATTSSGLQCSLKQRHMTMIALGGVIGAGLFVGSGVVIQSAGPAAIISFLHHRRARRAGDAHAGRNGGRHAGRRIVLRVRAARLGRTGRRAGSGGLPDRLDVLVLLGDRRGGRDGGRRQLLVQFWLPDVPRGCSAWY